MFKSFVHFLIGLLIFLLLNCSFNVFWILIPYQRHDLQVFFSFLWFFFSLSVVSFDIQKFQILMKFNLPIFVVVVYSLGVTFKKPSPIPKSLKIFPYISSKSLTVSALKFKSLIYFELTFAYSMM